MFYGTVDVFPRLVIPQFSRRLRRTSRTGRFVLYISVQAYNRSRSLARSLAPADISISPFAAKGATSPRVLINCPALCSALYAGSHLRFLVPPSPPFSSVFSSFYSARAQLPRRVSPIGITGAASENATALSLPGSYRIDLRDFRKIAKVDADRGFG